MHENMKEKKRGGPSSDTKHLKSYNNQDNLVLSGLKKQWDKIES